MTGTRTRWLLLGAVLAWLPVPLAAGADEKRKDGDKDNAPVERIPGVRVKSFDLKHRYPHEVLPVLRSLGSAVKGTAITGNEEFRAIMVRDFPENVAAVEEALKRLDVPARAKPDVEFRMHLLIATPTGPGQVPAELESVVKQLRGTLSFKGYHQVSSLTNRIKISSSAWGKGVVQLNPPVTTDASTLSYAFGFENVNLAPAGDGPARGTIQIRKFKFSVGAKGLGEADITTGLTIREGEKVVVGAANLKDRAMVLVLSARMLRDAVAAAKP